MGLERFLRNANPKIKMGVRRMVEGSKLRRIDAFNAHTIQTDSSANTLSDGSVAQVQTASDADALAVPNVKLRIHPRPIQRPRPKQHRNPHPPVQSFNWFIVSSHDLVTRRSNEVETVI